MPSRHLPSLNIVSPWQKRGIFRQPIWYYHIAAGKRSPASKTQRTSLVSIKATWLYLVGIYILNLRGEILGSFEGAFGITMRVPWRTSSYRGLSETTCLTGRPPEHLTGVKTASLRSRTHGVFPSAFRITTPAPQSDCRYCEFAFLLPDAKSV